MTGLVSFGNLARSLQLRADNSRLTADLSRLAGELSSGRKSEIGVGLSRDIGPVASIERSLSVLQSRTVAVIEGTLAADATQEALGHIADGAEALSASLLFIQGTGQAHLVDQAASNARQSFEAMVSTLNSSLSGRSLFSGAAFDRPALADAGEMLADLYAAVEGETSAEGAVAAIDAWFGPGGGFETSGYTGSDSPAAAVRLGPNESARSSVKANDPELVNMLKTVASAALLDMGLLNGDADQRSAMALQAGQAMLAASSDLIGLRSDVGIAQEQLDRASTRLSSERSSLQIARNEMVAADPYDSAIQLQTVERQLQTLYAMTGRMSDLSLTNYLR